MSELNWGELEKANQTQYKKTAEAGVYTVTLEKVEMSEKKSQGSGSYAMNFIIKEDDENKYPRITRWLSPTNQNWRAWHFKNILTVLGIPEDKARKAIELCESKKTYDDLAKTYAATLDMAAKKHNKIQIEVRQSVDQNGNPRTHEWTNDKTGETNTYPSMESEFKDPKVYFARKQNASVAAVESVVGNTDGVPADVDLSDIPF